jgi:molecular chaperone GrpE
MSDISDTIKEETAHEDGPSLKVLGEAQTDAPHEEEVLAEEQSPEKRVADLEAQLAQTNDQFLRKAADFENFRKRMNREKQEVIDFANQTLLLDMIEIIDDFDRAIKSAETSKDFESFYKGVDMIEKRLSSQLENKWGLKRFDSAGEPFDPNRHEAIMMEKSADINEPMVQEDFVKGYTLKDRVIRSAKVKVLMPEETGEA